MNWHPHSAARALGGAAAGAVGLVLARPTRTLGAEPFYAQLIYGMQSILSARSVALLLQVVDDTEAELAVYRRWAGEQRVDGCCWSTRRPGPTDPGGGPSWVCRRSCSAARRARRPAEHLGRRPRGDAGDGATTWRLWATAGSRTSPVPPRSSTPNAASGP